MALRSAPAQKVPSAPVRMATLTSGSAETYAQALARPISMSEESALRASGRFMVTITTWPSRSTRQCGVLMGRSSTEDLRDRTRAGGVIVTRRQPH